MTFQLPVETFLEKSGLSEETVQHLAELGVLTIKKNPNGRFVEGDDLASFLKDDSIHSEVRVSYESSAPQQTGSSSLFSEPNMQEHVLIDSLSSIQSSSLVNPSIIKFLVEKLAFKTEQCHWLQSEVERLKAELSQSKEIILSQTKALEKAVESKTSSFFDKFFEALGLIRKPINEPTNRSKESQKIN